MSGMLTAGTEFEPDAKDLASALHYLKNEDRQVLLGYLRGREFPLEEVLIEEKERADCMAFVVSGRLSVKKQTNFPGKQVLVAILESGSLVGESSVLDRGSRAATVDVLETSRLLVLSSDDFNRLLEEHPRLGIKILKRIIHVVSIRVKKADDRLAKLL